MTLQAPPSLVSEPVDAGRRIEQLRHILGLVEQIAGRDTSTPAEGAMDENARISSAYELASPVLRRRFDALTVETAAWAAAGIQALLVAKQGSNPPRAAAAGLAEELGTALRRLGRLIEADRKRPGKEGLGRIQAGPVEGAGRSSPSTTGAGAEGEWPLVSGQAGHSFT